MLLLVGMSLPALQLAGTLVAMRLQLTHLEADPARRVPRQ